MAKKDPRGGDDAPMTERPHEPDAAAERPRERIVACALDLFHRNGIRGVGVEAIVEAAHTNKMTLYRHFGSKDDLILEYLNYKGRKTDEIWAEDRGRVARAIRSASFTASSGRRRNSSPRTSAAAISPTPRSS